MRAPGGAGAVDGGGLVEGEGGVSFLRSSLREGFNGNRKLVAGLSTWDNIIFMTVGKDPYS